MDRAALCPLKVCAGTPVARQSNDLRDCEPSLFFGHFDSLADARQAADAVEKHVARGRRYAQQVVLGLDRSRIRRNRLLLGPDVHLYVFPGALPLELLAKLGELELLGFNPGA